MSNDTSIEGFNRIVHGSRLIDPEDLNSEMTKYSVLSKIYEITRSKITTNLLLEGKPNFTVIDAEPQENEVYYATALLCLHPLEVIFHNVKSLTDVKVTRNYKLEIGDLLMFYGINFDKIFLEDNTPAHLNRHYKIIRYAVKEKVPNGTGSNKYKASITFSDTYELEIFADSEKEAREIALKTKFYDWDHIFNIDKDKYEDYVVQEIRHSSWLPQEIQIERSKND